MLFQPKHLPAVTPHALEHAVAVEQPVVIDADLRVLLVEQMAVDVNLQGHVETTPLAWSEPFRYRVDRKGKLPQNTEGNGAERARALLHRTRIST